MYLYIWEMSYSKSDLIPLYSIWRGTSFFSHLPLCSSEGTQHCLPFLFPPFHLFHFSLWMLIFLQRAVLGMMVNRRGTEGTRARLSRDRVIPTYVSSTDVLLTSIDFHLFISTLRIPPPPLSPCFSPCLCLWKKKTCHSERHCCAESKFDLTCLSFVYVFVCLHVCVPSVPATCAWMVAQAPPIPLTPPDSWNLKASSSPYCPMLPHILSAWIGISFEQFHSDKSLLKVAPPREGDPFIYLFWVILFGGRLQGLCLTCSAVPVNISISL